MTVININPCDRMKEGVIGHVRENEVTQIVFDLSAWIAEYGLGTVALSVMRQGDLVPYPMPIAIVDGKATWTISATDTAKHGRIKAQLSYMVGTKVKKTNVYTLSTKESLPVDGDAPEAYETWLEILQTMTAETAANAQTATAAAESASADAGTAASAAAIAVENAISASESASAAHTAETNAEGWAELAQQVATDNGYAQMYIDDDGTLYLARTTNIVDKLDFDLTSDGELEVLIYG